MIRPVPGYELLRIRILHPPEAHERFILCMSRLTAFSINFILRTSSSISIFINERSPCVDAVQNAIENGLQRSSRMQRDRLGQTEKLFRNSWHRAVDDFCLLVVE